MTNKIYDSVMNVNERALVVPQQEGGAEDDNYFGSIGDATMRHVSRLSDGDRQLWEALIHTRSGKIFRAEPSTTMFDKDPMNLRGEDLGEWLSRYAKIPTKWNEAGEVVEYRPPTKSEMEAYREAVEVEQERRMQSEDAYDHADTLPYSQLEKFPGMEKHIDMPKTPRDMMIYMGNSGQMFYDEFPEGHPNAGMINAALGMLNKEWDDITTDYAEWFSNWANNAPMRRYVSSLLSKLCYAIAETEKSPVVMTEAVLEAIDRVWAEQWHQKARERLQKDALYMMLKRNEKLWDHEAKQGQTLHNKIRAFGQILWRDHKDKMKTHHWSLYRKIRDKHCPKVYVRGIDINKCDMTKLKSIFGDSLARKIWVKRPFYSLEQAHDQGLITRRAFAVDERSERIMQGMEKALEMSKERKSARIFNSYRGKMIDAQRNKAGGKINWSPIWAYYHLLKKELDTFLAELKQEQTDGRGTEDSQEQAA